VTARRVLFLLPLVLFAVLAGYFWVELRSGRDPHELPSAMIDRPAPRFALAGLDGSAGLDRQELGAGNVAIVNFFASWCVPCRLEQPLLMGLGKELAVPLYGIAWEDKADDAAQYLKELGDPYNSVGLDESGRVGINFGVYGVPETYVVDKEGRIRLRVVGPLTPEEIANELAPLIKRLERS
jgi:cytochrome c biogenesis protein CcmG, thiol:disulfide interchange protein DsbE